MVANITDAAMSHGFTLGCQTVVSAVGEAAGDMNDSPRENDETVAVVVQSDGD
jgi:hypothetical protein